MSDEEIDVNNEGLELGDPTYRLHVHPTLKEMAWVRKCGCPHPEGCQRTCIHFTNNTCPLT